MALRSDPDFEKAATTLTSDTNYINTVMARGPMHEPHTPPQKRPRRELPSPGAPSPKGQICRNYNEGKCDDTSQCGRKHICSICFKPNHRAKDCWLRPGAPPQQTSPTKGKGKSKGKNKGKK